MINVMMNAQMLMCLLIFPSHCIILNSQYSILLILILILIVIEHFECKDKSGHGDDQTNAIVNVNVNENEKNIVYGERGRTKT